MQKLQGLFTSQGLPLPWTSGMKVLALQEKDLLHFSDLGPAHEW